jgi:GNAT superfamily N-acetyltransferase
LNRDPRPLEPLADALDLAAFDCGEPSLNDWLARRAAAAEGRTARTYVVVEGTRVLGYYCLSAGALDRALWPGHIRRNAPDPVPAILIGRLAVDRPIQGQGLAKDLMLHALEQSHSATRIVGARAVVVHALNDRVAAFYGRLGFIGFASLPLALFLPFETVAKTLARLAAPRA